MVLKVLPYHLTVCKVPNITEIDMTSELFFISKTDEELSLVCKTEDTPSKTTECEHGWKGFRIGGTGEVGQGTVPCPMLALQAMNCFAA